MLNTILTYENIGSKIKKLAYISAIAGAIISIAYAIIMIIETGYHSFDRVWIYIGLIIVGPLMSWLSSFLIYGFGELIDNTHQTTYPDNRLLKTTDKYIEDICANEKADFISSTLKIKNNKTYYMISIFETEPSANDVFTDKLDSQHLRTLEKRLGIKNIIPVICYYNSIGELKYRIYNPAVIDRQTIGELLTEWN